MKRPSEIVGERLRFVRDRAGLSLRELSTALEAEGVDLNPNALSRIENDKRRIDVDELLAVAAVLGISPLGLLATRYDEEVAITEERTVEAGDMWEWLTRKYALPGMDDDFYRAHSTRPDLERYLIVSTAATEVAAWEEFLEMAQERDDDEAASLAERRIAEANERLDEARQEAEAAVEDQRRTDRWRLDEGQPSIRDIERAIQRSRRLGTSLEEEL